MEKKPQQETREWTHVNNDNHPSTYSQDASLRDCVIAADDYVGLPLESLDTEQILGYCASIAEDDTIEWKSITATIYLQAISLATTWHDGQTRSTKPGQPRTPYINHPLRNTARIYTWGHNDGEVLAASILHDTIEDCADKITGHSIDANYDQTTQRKEAIEVLTHLFSPQVTDIVVAVSNPVITDEHMTQEEKKKSYIHHLEASLPNPQAFLVKLSDYIDNTGSLHHQVTSRNTKRMTKLYNKYTQALPVFQNASAIHERSYTNIQNKRIQNELSLVEDNLSKLGSKIETLSNEH